MSGPIRRAMFLAAGLGTRMRPLTRNRPKALIEIDGRPFIDHALDRLSSAGVEEVVINLHYLPDMIRDHVRERARPRIRFSDESDMILGTGGAVVRALPLLGSAPFFVHNSDSYWIEGMGKTLDRMIDMWSADTMDALLLVAPSVSTVGMDEARGDYRLRGDGQLVRRRDNRVAPFYFAGVYIAHPRLFADPPDPPFSAVALFDRAEAAERLFGLRHNGMWIHGGTPAALDEAEAAIRDL